jgi:hypothetical protein
VLQGVFRKARLDRREINAGGGEAIPAPAAQKGAAFIARGARFDGDDSGDGGFGENHKAQTSAALS